MLAVTREQRALAIARIVVGLAILVRTTPLAAWLHHPLLDVPSTLLGWPDEGWHLPLGPALPSDALRALCIARTALASMFALGVKPRVSGIAVGVAGLAVAMDDVFASSHTFRLLYGSAIVLATTDCASTWALRREPLVSSAASVSSVRWWLTSIYAWAAIAKLNVGWLSGHALVLDARDGVFHGWAASALSDATTRIASAGCVVAVELGIALMLIVPRTRRVAVVVAALTQCVFEAATSPDLFGVIVAVLLGVVWAEPPTERAARAAADPIHVR